MKKIVGFFLALVAAISFAGPFAGVSLTPSGDLYIHGQLHQNQ